MVVFNKIILPEPFITDQRMMIDYDKSSVMMRCLNSDQHLQGCQNFTRSMGKVYYLNLECTSACVMFQA